MTITHRLLERNYLIVAIAWTLFVTAICLISLNLEGVNAVPIQNKDKVAHFCFYFIFVILWSKAIKKVKSSYIVIVAVFYGIIIEVLQSVFTTTREADFYDIVANTLGAFLAMFVFRFFKK